MDVFWVELAVGFVVESKEPNNGACVVDVGFVLLVDDAVNPKPLNPPNGLASMEALVDEPKPPKGGPGFFVSETKLLSASIKFALEVGREKLNEF